ncbi:unnamed protein product [Sphagnum balticum]
MEAATDSRVYVRLHGTTATTDSRHMYSHEQRNKDTKVFRTGQTDSFILTTSRWLGDIQSLCLWHDNSGEGMFKSWKCSQIVVTDHTTGVQYPFIVDRFVCLRQSVTKKVSFSSWLACDEGDGSIMLHVPLSTRLDLAQYRHALERSAKANMRDGHLW